MPPSQPQQAKPHTEHARQTKQLHAMIGHQVIQTLGQARNLHKLQVHHLWGHCYRVNIVVGKDPLSVKIAHSFFLEVDGEGNILTSTPRITRHYATPDTAGGAATNAIPGQVI
ncbi:MAG TPA: hypothetical protein VFA18_11090 [Gemmataceae bacterium]|nr:hypothetical protein [Gemmataceae bacterium]